MTRSTPSALDPTGFGPVDLAGARRLVETQRNLRAPDRSTVVELGSGHPDRELDRIGPDTVAVVADCVLWDERWSVDHLARLARDDSAHNSAGTRARWLVFVEPVIDLGWRAALARRLAARDRGRYGHHFTRDLPRDLRAAGLTVTTVVRFDVDRRLTYAWGEARHVAERPQLDDGDGAAQRR